MVGLFGDVMLIPPLTWVMLVDWKNAWLMLRPCVEEGSRIHVAEVMLAASGVPTKMVCPVATLEGAEVMVGRAPANR